MTDIPTAFPAQTLVVEDSSKRQSTENIVHDEPPAYEFLKSTALNNNRNTNGPSTIQCQPLLTTTENIGHTQNMYDVPSTMTKELAQIDSYKGWSILNILCCCLCLGLIACYYSTETQHSIVRRDIQGALKASKKARTINIIATIVGIIVMIVYFYYRTQISYTYY